MVSDVERTIWLSSSRDQWIIGLWMSENQGHMFLKNTQNLLPSDVVSYPTRPESSFFERLVSLCQKVWCHVSKGQCIQITGNCWIVCKSMSLFSYCGLLPFLGCATCIVFCLCVCLFPPRCFQDTFVALG